MGGGAGAPQTGGGLGRGWDPSLRNQPCLPCWVCRELGRAERGRGRLGVASCCSPLCNTLVLDLGGERVTQRLGLQRILFSSACQRSSPGMLVRLQAVMDGGKAGAEGRWRVQVKDRPFHSAYGKAACHHAFPGGLRAAGAASSPSLTRLPLPVVTLEARKGATPSLPSWTSPSQGQILHAGTAGENPGGFLLPQAFACPFWLWGGRDSRCASCPCLSFLLLGWGTLGLPFASTAPPPPHPMLRSLGEPPQSPARLGTAPRVRACAREQAVFGGGLLLEQRALAGKQHLSFGVSLCWGRQQLWEKGSFSAKLPAP